MRRVLLACGGIALVVIAAQAQTKPLPAQVNAAPLRTPWGAPDLQGVWNVASGTPLERPAALAGKEFFTDEELTLAAKQANERASADRRDETASIGDLRREHNDFWFDKRNTFLTRRTSLVVDPPDGRLPPETPEAAKKPRPVDNEFLGTDGPEARGLNERCIILGLNGPPILPLTGGLNQQLLGHRWQFQIVQSPNHVAIVSEYIEQVRIIPLDGRPHLPQNVRLWLGDSRGRWEGSTLVIETTNFSDKRTFLGLSAENMHLVERFTRTATGTLEYQFTVDDPTRWTKPWTAVVPVEKTDGQLYEFACHEGNYGLQNILSIARALEKEAGAKH